MTSLRSLVERVITELTKLQAAPKPKNEKGEEAFPRLIDAGNGGALLVNKSIDHDISSVAEILMSNDQALALRYSVAEWTGAVRRAFGPALVRIDLAGDVASNADQVLSDVRDVLKRHTSAQGTREFAFGCSLFRNQDTKSFSIGPVRFELRQEWMLRKHSEGAISKTSRRRLEAAWTGQRLIDRKPSRDRLIETGILDASGDCPFICSVVTEGLLLLGVRRYLIETSAEQRHQHNWICFWRLSHCFSYCVGRGVG